MLKRSYDLDIYDIKLQLKEKNYIYCDRECAYLLREGFAVI